MVGYYGRPCQAPRSTSTYISKLCLKFAKQCLRHDKLKELFPRHERIHDMEKRNCEKFVVKKAMTEWYTGNQLCKVCRDF